MKNHHIDFFSSPTCKFIGFSEIRQPHHDMHYHEINEEQEAQSEKKQIRKLSFNYGIEPIVPFPSDFFDEELQQCQESQSQIEINQQLNQERIHQPLEKTIFDADNLRNSNLKLSFFVNTHPAEYEDMLFGQDQNKNQNKDKLSSNLFDEEFLTPKRKKVFFDNKRFFQSTGEKTISRNNQKGLRKLSSLAFSIVSQSAATTYKEVAEKLLTHLNFDSNDLDQEQCRAERSSMQNVKRRVYDSLNVLIALGVIKRIGNKITKQKQKKPFLSGQYPDGDRYNDMLIQYKKKLLNVEAKKKTQRQLKQKLQIFKKTIQRNRKTKNISKSKMIKLPFLVFVTQNDHCENKEESKICEKIEWVNKKSDDHFEKEKKKTGNKRNQSVDSHKNGQSDSIVQIKLKGYPESYGDLDFFRLIQQQNSLQDKKDHKLEPWAIKQNKMQEQYASHLQQYKNIKLREGNVLANLLDEVFEYR